MKRRNRTPTALVLLERSPITEFIVDAEFGLRDIIIPSKSSPFQSKSTCFICGSSFQFPSKSQKIKGCSPAEQLSLLQTHLGHAIGNLFPLEGGSSSEKGCCSLCVNSLEQLSSLKENVAKLELRIEEVRNLLESKLHYSRSSRKKHLGAGHSSADRTPGSAVECLPKRVETKNQDIKLEETDVKPIIVHFEEEILNTEIEEGQIKYEESVTPIEPPRGQKRLLRSFPSPEHGTEDEMSPECHGAKRRQKQRTERRDPLHLDCTEESNNIILRQIRKNDCQFPSDENLDVNVQHMLTHMVQQQHFIKAQINQTRVSCSQPAKK